MYMYLEVEREREGGEKRDKEREGGSYEERKRKREG